MKIPSLCAAALFLSILGFAQQPNDPAKGSMILNGNNGPPYPITGVQFQRGTSSNVVISGLPNQPFIVAGSSGLLPTGVSELGGLRDLNTSGFAVVFSGLSNGLFYTSPQGQWTANLPISQTTALNTTRSFQGMVADPTVPSNVTLTAATQIAVVLGLTTTPMTLGDDDFVNFSLNPFGFTLPFYTATYSSFFVNANGFLSFVSGTGDFTPTSAAFNQQMPRACGFWCDLSPQAGGSINVVIDQTVPSLPQVRLNFTNVPEFGSSTPHTFSIAVYSIVGDVIIAISGFNANPLIATLVGIGPGNNLSNHPPKDLSALGLAGVQGVVNENFHQLFQPGIGWDLQGRTLTFSGLGIGTPTASYLGTSFP